ncbi:MAG: hypothetical protein KJO18_05185, partial [Acidimicrobiia bacterium]|nr:hypothetical protein [Acidimicrobiia bacterium]
MTFTRALVPRSRRRVVSLIAAFVLAVGPVTIVGPSEVRALETVSGVVFEDIAGDGLTDGGIGSPNNPGVIGVRVALYLDDGNGIPDGADTWVTDDVTDASGAYSLVLATAVDHWVVVDSRDVNPSVGSAIDAEQTYGPAGGLCTNGDSPETFTVLVSARSCYGGYRGDVVDGNNIAVNAEHLALVNT